MHTPGPWKYQQESIDPSWTIVTNEAGAVVANVNSETGPDATSAPATRKMPGEDNARLIAAAPALLKAAQAIEDARQEGQDPDGIVRIPADDPVWVRVRAAIAQATPEKT